MDNELVPQETLSAADSVLPRFDGSDDKKRLYLSYRLCGFGRDDATKLSGVGSRKTIYNWLKQDPAFKQVEETELVTLRKNFSKDIIALDFTRNFKLVLEKDYKVLRLAVEAPQLLSKEDNEYLGKIRGYYTPQQLQILEGFFSKKDSSGFDFDELILIARRTHGQIQEVNSNQAQRRDEEHTQGTVIEGGFERREEEE